MKRSVITVICLLLQVGVVTARAEDLFTRERPLMEVTAPTQWSFYKFIEQPVGLYRGAVSVDIPLFTLRDGEVELPITLRYNTSGIKVSEEASWVGLGWNLDVAGYLTCNVVDGYDYKDDTFDSLFKSRYYPASHGYVYEHGSQFEDMSDWLSNPWFSQDMDHYHWGKLSPDVYYFSYPGGAGRYVIDWRDGSVVQLTREEALLIDNGITSTEFPSKTITTASGIRHTFDYAGSTGVYGKTDPIAFSYTLSRTDYPSGGYVQYSWTDIDYEEYIWSASISGSYITDVLGYAQVFTNSPSVNHDYTRIEKRESLPTEILTQNYRVVFITGNRTDHSALKKLEAVELRDRSSGTLLRRFEFTYGYFLPQNGVVDAQAQTRLKLTQVREVSPTDYSVSIGRHDFQYNETALPAKNSLGYDHWGFSNASSASVKGQHVADVSKLRALFTDENNYTKASTISAPKYDHAANETYTSAAMLTQVSWPDGGRTTFTYEPNTFWGLKIPKHGELAPPAATAHDNAQSSGCGVRIASVSHFEKDGITAKSVRQYTYDDPLTGHSSGHLFDIPRYWTDYSGAGYTYVRYGGENIVALPQFLLSDVINTANPYGWSSGVGYAYVKETINAIGGATEYRFANDAENDMPLSYRVGKPLNGKMLSKTVTNASGIVLMSSTYSYSQAYSHYYYGINLVNQWYPFPSTVNIMNSFWQQEASLSDTPHYYPNYHLILEYALNGTDVLLSGISDSTDGVTVYTGWTYDSETLLPVSKTISGGDGTIFKTTYTYPKDYSDGTSQQLVSKHILSPVIETRTYVNNILADASLCLPDEDGVMTTLYYADLSSPSASTAPAFTPSGFPNPVIYPVAAADRLGYDARNNPFGYRYGNMLDEVWLWGYGWRYPIAKIEGSTLAAVTSALGITPASLAAQITPNMTIVDGLRSSLSSALVTTWTYDNLGNLTSETSPAGEKTVYGYDAFGRLASASIIVSGQTLPLDRWSYGDDSITHELVTNASGAISVKDITYSNGLGLPQQTLHTKYASSGATLVELTDYDAALRPSMHYLPYSTGTVTENRQTNAASAVSQYWSSRFPGEGRQFTATGYEPAPTARATRETKPGNTMYYGGFHVLTAYRANVAAEVRKLSVNTSGTLVASGFFPAGSLNVQEVTDEDGVKTSIFTDKFGNVVLERNYPSSGQTADTYYVRDGKYLLRRVITPEGSALLSTTGSWSAASSLVADWSYNYEYDGRRRLVEKKIPGVAAEYLVLDNMDRIVARQTAADRAAVLWRTYTFDAAGRPSEERLQAVSLSRTAMQASWASYAASGKLVSRTQYDSYPTSPMNVFSPISGVAEVTDMNFSPKGKPTFEMVADMASLDTNSPTYKTKYFFYDRRGRLAQTYESSGGNTVRTTLGYDHRDNITTTVETAGGVTVREYYSYDNRSRLVHTSVSVDGVFIGSVARSYDDLGRPVSKTFGNGVTESYTYNFQGWQTAASAARTGNTLFSETLHYYSGVTSGTPLYSGRIAGRSGSQNGTAFSDFYSYDGTGRMTGSAVSTPTNTETAITYDRSGNVLTLKRYAGSTLSDNFTWAYTGFRRNGYSYDAGGNVTSDGNGSFTATYYRLGLPKTLTASGATTTYSFTADGTKESALQSDGSGYVYLGSMRFSKNASGTLAFDSAPWDGGRIVAGSTAGAYDLQYFTTDHLGSVRVVTGGSGNVVFSSGYMPYGTGTNTAGSAMNEFRFSGKEVQPQAGLLDFGARLYDPRSASWLSLDPMAEKYYSVSPYAYCANDPLDLVDPEGEVPHVVIGAVVGGFVNGGIALCQGKTSREIMGAFIGGAIGGAISAATFGAATELGVGIALSNIVSSSLGNVASSITEQVIDSDGFNGMQVAIDGLSGAVTGAVILPADAVLSKFEKQLLSAIDKYYSSSAVSKSIRKEVASEFRDAGKKISGPSTKKALNKEVSNRINTLSSFEKSSVSVFIETVETVHDDALEWGTGELILWLNEKKQ